MDTIQQYGIGDDKVEQFPFDYQLPLEFNVSAQKQLFYPLDNRFVLPFIEFCVNYIRSATGYQLEKVEAFRENCSAKIKQNIENQISSCKDFLLRAVDYQYLYSLCLLANAQTMSQTVPLYVMECADYDEELAQN